MSSNRRARALACERRRVNPLTRIAYPCSRTTLDCTLAGEQVPAGKRCIVVADARSARILLSASQQGSARELIEHSELENCARRRASVDHQFAAALAHHVAAIVRDWDTGSVVIAASPEMLGLVRQVVQDALPKGVTLKALAKDYVALSAPELSERLNF